MSNEQRIFQPRRKQRVMPLWLAVILGLILAYAFWLSKEQGQSRLGPQQKSQPLTQNPLA